METNLEKKSLQKSLQGISSGLQMLSEQKPLYMAALAEISIILGREDVRDRYSLEDDVYEFLGSLHFLLKDLGEESVKIVTYHINEKLGNHTDTSDYKLKYEQTLEKLLKANEEILSLKEIAVN